LRKIKKEKKEKKIKKDKKVKKEKNKNDDKVEVKVEDDKNEIDTSVNSTNNTFENTKTSSINTPLISNSTETSSNQNISSSNVEQSLRKNHKKENMTNVESQKDTADTLTLNNSTTEASKTEKNKENESTEENLKNIPNNQNETHIEVNPSHTVTETQESNKNSTIVEAINKSAENNSVSPLNLETLKTISGDINLSFTLPKFDTTFLQQTNCQESCVKKCTILYTKYEEIKDCGTKGCNCNDTDLINALVSIKKQLSNSNSDENPSVFLKTLLNSLIIVSLLSLAFSLAIIGIVIYRKKKDTPTYYNEYDSINLNFPDELLEEGKKNEGKVFDSHYELMTTEIEDDDTNELCIRDF
jgi:hypothetical protein